MIPLLAALAVATPIEAPPRYEPPTPIGAPVPVVTADGTPLPAPPVLDWTAVAALADGTPLPDFDRGRTARHRRNLDVVATVIGLAVTVGLAAPLVVSAADPTIP